MASTSGDPSAAEALRRGRILSSRLYLDGVPSSKAPVVYSPAYDIEFNGIEKQHPFDSAKWGRVRNFLVDAGLLQNDRIIEPLEASEDDLLVVHSESYLNSLKSSAKVARIVEVPAVALLPNLLVQQKLLYPFRKQDHVAKKYIDQKIELHSGTKTEDYLEILDKALKVAESRFQPQLILYNAGTDILDGDPLGSLKVSPDGVITRDEKVFRFAKDQSIPLLMLTSGGYMKSSARVIADSIINLSNKNLIDIDTHCIEIE